MSWANELYRVYDKALALTSENVPLLPIAHSTAKAQLEVTIDGNGNFMGADIVPGNEEAVTIIPVTEDSGARANGVSPHPLSDKLIYIAGDYGDFCSMSKIDKDKFPAYINQLLNWKNSEFSHLSLDAIYAYLSQKTLMHDLVNARILKVDENGQLTNDKVEKIAQSDCFVRFRVNGEKGEARTWLDRTLYDSFIAYNASMQEEKSFCYATGEQAFCTYKHPSKILNSGDKGKLFSANDDSGFSYRGRFLDKKQAVSIGYEFSQKMHNTLKWLIERQGVAFGTLTILTWNSVLGKLPKLCHDSQNILSDSYDDFGTNPDSESDAVDYDSFGSDSDMAFPPMPETFSSYKGAIKKAVFSYKRDKKDPDFEQNVMILVLDEATTGRVSVNMYSKLSESEFYENLLCWHLNTAWRRYDFKRKEEYIGSFGLLQTIDYAFGTEQNEHMVCEPKQKSDAITRLLPCVVEGRRFPKDVLQRLKAKACRPTSFSSQGNWRKAIDIACAMIQNDKIKEGKDHSMSLDAECNSRDYLYGRLLAVAEAAEASTYDKEQARPTNAEKYFEKFSNNPYNTWVVIYNRLKPYLNGMKPGGKIYYQGLIDTIMSRFAHEDFMDNSKLDSEFLLGYSNQRYALYHSGKNSGSNQGGNSTENKESNRDENHLEED